MRIPDISVVVPAFNEERFIAELVSALRQFSGSLLAEIIVVDNGSTDSTVELARAAGADVVLSKKGTVAAVRNAGARCATAEVLLFMDADVSPTMQWANRLPFVLQEVRGNPRLLTGSWVSVPEPGTWIERHWFKPLEHGRNTHINSGHMIISRRFFDELGGFDPKLRTGEDADLSRRAESAGAEIRDDSTLRVIHHGYPRSVREFFRREVWHGIGDWQSFRTLLTSGVAAVGCFVLHGQAVGWMLTLVTADLSYGISATLVSLGLSLAASLHRYRSVGPTTRVVTTGLYFVYFVARGMSLYAALRNETRSLPADGSRH
jgi:glycosyltransferase involved in cell wall biosynthesis